VLHASGGKDGGVKKNCEINKDVTVSDVVQVVLNILVDEIVAIGTDLPQTGYTGFHSQAAPMSSQTTVPRSFVPR
ncbi:MAG: hypothetical protein WCC59_16670, partial [Terriglobales bacterium]